MLWLRASADAWDSLALGRSKLHFGQPPEEPHLASLCVSDSRTAVWHRPTTRAPLWNCRDLASLAFLEAREWECLFSSIPLKSVSGVSLCWVGSWGGGAWRKVREKPCSEGLSEELLYPLCLLVYVVFCFSYHILYFLSVTRKKQIYKAYTDLDNAAWDQVNTFMCGITFTTITAKTRLVEIRNCAIPSSEATHFSEYLLAQ